MLGDTGQVPVPVEDVDPPCGEHADEVVAEGRNLGRDEPEADGELLEGVRLSVETPLRDLKGVCSRLGLPTSGGKTKILKRLRMHYEVLEKQMATEIARKMYAEEERNPDIPKAPVLPSARQQELHAVTHQPFAPWCQACVMGRSRQSPHRQQHVQKREDDDATTNVPKIQVDYCYTFTKERHEVQLEAGHQEEAPEDDQQADHAEDGGEGRDLRDQFGLNLIACESTTGWITAIPLLEKGAASLKRTTEQLVRLSMQVTATERVMLQGDTEPSVKQVLNSVEACRTRLGLATEKRLIPRGSHASNGQVEKAVDTVRRNSLTLKAHLEDRIGAAIGGHCHIYAWIMRHAAYLHNRFFSGSRGAPAYEVMYGRGFKGKLLPFGEQCIFHKPSRHKGDLQWQRGIWVGVNERNGAHLVFTDDGAVETRSIRRLPAQEQWSAAKVVSARGLPWGLRRHRCLKSSSPSRHR